MNKIKSEVKLGIKPLFSSLKSLQDRENDLLRDEVALAVLMELGRKQKLTFNQIHGYIQVDKNLLIDKVRILEAGAYIKQNPNQDTTRPFDERKYVIDLKGIFFLNKVRKNFSEFTDSFNFFF